MTPHIVYTIEDRPVDVTADVWVVQSRKGTLRCDWNMLSDLPEYVRAPAREHMQDLITSQSFASIGAFFGRTLMYLQKCPSIRSSGAIDETTFEELRTRLKGDKASLSRFRTFYSHAALDGWPGFDEGTAEVLESLVIGAHRAPHPTKGRHPALVEDESLWLKRAVAHSGQLLSAKEKLLIQTGLKYATNEEMLIFLTAASLREIAPGDFVIDMPRHKKQLPKFATVPRPATAKQAAWISRLIADNRAAAAATRWPDGTIGLPPNVILPLFMRPMPRPSQSFAADRAYALHHLQGEISALIGKTVERLVAADDQAPPLARVVSRVLRRTRLTEVRQQGAPDPVVGGLADHAPLTFTMDRYAHGGGRIVPHLDRHIGPALADLCAPDQVAATSLRFVSVTAEALRKRNAR